jgi:hypothetical protein
MPVRFDQRCLQFGAFGIAIRVILTTSEVVSGGSNDRAWQPYSLGPCEAKDDFNETNMKIAFSSEFRFGRALLLMQVISGMFTTT